ncbi:MAG: DJ-1/PfpI family protein [Anaerolineales bacterium]|nr:DJ-1/PfpI family protein [Anaerolineales bacterium]MCB9146420.1 DJ-1/PfpI family protein [Anaerolineales bacterium]
MNIGIYIYDEVEVLDFSGPFEVFTTASRVYERIYPDTPKLFNVFLIAEKAGMISARANFNVQPHYTIQDHPELYVLIVPGGVHAHELGKANVIEWLAKVSPNTTLTASVCTGAFLLAKAGILKDKACTTHWEDVDDLRTMFPALNVKEDVPWVDNGQVITSAGISAGIEMALHLVSKLTTKEIAKLTARQMQYTWTNESLSQEQK